MNSGEKIFLPEWTLMSDNKPQVIELNEDIQPPWGEQPQYIS
jgi:hypothetical protein